MTVGCHDLTGHAAGGVMLQTGVQYAVGNEVAQLVGMSLGHGFGCEKVIKEAHRRQEIRRGAKPRSIIQRKVGIGQIIICRL